MKERNNISIKNNKVNNNVNNRISNSNNTSKSIYYNETKSKIDNGKKNIHREIFFDEKEHKYTDNAGNIYTSCTTILSKYKEEFKKKEIAISCSRKRDSKYYGWRVQDILKDWEKINSEALERGKEKHNYLEDIVKKSSGYRKINGKISDRIHTVLDIGRNITYGRLNIDYFTESGILDVYPSIYKLIVDIVNRGYYIYSEIAAYSYEYLTSGLLDLLFVKQDFTKFVILDYKTNADEITTKSGYYKKDKFGNRTDIWIDTNERFLPPIDKYKHCTFNEYSLQTSIYAWLTELSGMKCAAIFLAHIRHERDENNLEKVDFYELPYLKEDVEMLIKHHYETYILKNRNKQLKLKL